MQCPLKKPTVYDLRRLAFLFVCLFVSFFYGNFKKQEKWHPSLFIYLVTTAVQFSFILSGWLRKFILLFHFVFTSKFVSHDQCHNVSLLFRGVNYAAAASYSYASPWPLTLRHQSLTCDSRVTRVSYSPLRLRRRRLMHQYLVTRDCFMPNGSWSQREFSSNPNTDFFLNNTRSKNMTNLHHWRK